MMEVVGSVAACKVVVARVVVEWEVVAREVETMEEEVKVLGGSDGKVAVTAAMAMATWR